MPELNFFSTNSTDTTGAHGLVQQPQLGTVTPGYNYGSAGNATGNGFMEYGAGTAGSLPFKVDQAGNVTTTGNVTAASTSVTPAVVAPTFANGTAAQLADLTRDYMVYLAVTTSGTATTVAIGPTSTPANTILPSSSVTAGQMITFRLPAAWYVKWAGTTTAIATQTAIGC